MQLEAASLSRREVICHCQNQRILAYHHQPPPPPAPSPSPLNPSSNVAEFLMNRKHIDIVLWVIDHLKESDVRFKWVVLTGRVEGWGRRRRRGALAWHTNEQGCQMVVTLSAFKKLDASFDLSRKVTNFLRKFEKTYGRCHERGGYPSFYSSLNLTYGEPINPLVSSIYIKPKNLSVRLIAFNLFHNECEFNAR